MDLAFTEKAKKDQLKRLKERFEDVTGLVKALDSNTANGIMD
jgi:hypothetical protein